MRFDSNFRNVRHLESIDLHDERMDIVSSLFCDPALHEEGRRVQSDWQRNTYTHHTNSMSRATCSLVLHRFGGRASQEPLQKKKEKTLVTRFSRAKGTRLHGTRIHDEQWATSNAIFERRPPTPLLDIPIPFSFISSYFTSAIIPRLARTVANGVVRASNANQRVPIYFVSASSDTRPRH